MEENERMSDWKSRWCEDTMFEYLKMEPPSFRTWWEHFNDDDDEPKEETSLSAKEKLEQAEVAEYEVVDDTPMVLGYAH